jgi:purine nucleosidase
MTNDRIPVLLDTDIGSDIDDAICLAYLLRQPRCELLGITTVSGRDVRQRSALADALLREAGRPEIPVHTGCPARMRDGEVMQPDVPQAAMLPQYPHRAAEQFEQATAVEFLRRTIRARPGEITLLAIGPMTNLGMLFTLDPEIPRLLKGLVLMCGMFGMVAWHGNAHREWNALCDAEATDAVYRARPPVHRSVGLDVTTQVTMPPAEVIRRLRACRRPLGSLVAMLEIWAAHAEKHQHPVTFHDPLAAVSIFREGVLGWRAGEVATETGAGRHAGMTLFKAGDGGPHQVAATVDAAGFFDEYFGVLGG